MEVYLLRHGIAEDARAGQPDAERNLTPEGRDKLRRVLRRARIAGVQPSVILASPLRRAIETAEIAAEVLGYKGTVARTRSLVPDAHPAEVWDEIRARKDEPAILLAGHEPQMSTSVAFLLDAPSLAVDMKKAALVRLDCERFGPKPACVLKWMLTPALAAEPRF